MKSDEKEYGGAFFRYCIICTNFAKKWMCVRLLTKLSGRRSKVNANKFDW